MERVAVIGCCPPGYRFAYGAGKSTLSDRLGLKFGLPIIHLDAYYWQPGWIETPKEEWIAIHQSLVTSDRWIIDGNYLGTMDSRLQAADTVIWLDFSRLFCLWRILQRYLRYRGAVRSDMANGCPERWDWDFFLYVWHFYDAQRPSIISKLEFYKDTKQIVVLNNPQQVTNFLSQLQ